MTTGTRPNDSYTSAHHDPPTRIHPHEQRTGLTSEVYPQYCSIGTTTLIASSVSTSGAVMFFFWSVSACIREHRVMSWLWGSHPICGDNRHELGLLDVRRCSVAGEAETRTVASEGCARSRVLFDTTRDANHWVVLAQKLVWVLVEALLCVQKHEAFWPEGLSR